MVNKLVSRERPSLHAAEMNFLINQAEGPAAAKLRASLATMAASTQAPPPIPD